MARNYDYVILQNWTASRVPALKEINPRLKVFFYRFAHATWKWQENWSEINQHESWFLHDSQGRRTRKADGDDNSRWYLMNLRNHEFRAYQIRYIMSFVDKFGFDGVFWDGPPGAITGYLALNPAAPADAAAFWHDDVLVFLRELKQALGSKLLITNSTATYITGVAGTDDTDYLAYVDGTMIEGFGHAPWQSYTYVQSAASWAWQQRMFQRNLDAGKSVFVLGGVQLNGAPAHGIHRWQIYTYASYLLRADGAHSVYQWNYVNTPNFFPEMSLQLGIPTRETYYDQGVHQRDFTYGRVLVNVSGTEKTVDLTWRYRTTDGRSVTRVTLEPWTAVIVLR